jgi:hypothetical protein
MRSVNKRLKVQTGLGKNLRYYLKNNESKKSWGHGSSGRVPA